MVIWFHISDLWATVLSGHVWEVLVGTFVCCQPKVSFTCFDVHDPSFDFLTALLFGSRCIGLWLVDVPSSFQFLQSWLTPQMVCLLCETLIDVVCFISIDAVV